MIALARALRDVRRGASYVYRGETISEVNAVGGLLEERFYLMRFVAHRKTFAQDMTDEERATMGRHVAYWTERIREGSAIIFGPVIDPRESWGFAVLRVASEAAALALAGNDPAIGLGRHEVLLIPQLIRSPL